AGARAGLRRCAALGFCGQRAGLGGGPDRPRVLDLTRANVARNLPAIRAVRRHSSGCSEAELKEEDIHIRVQELYFGDDAALAAALGSGAPEAPLLVLCSDCIWRGFLHRPLLVTIATALSLARDQDRGEAAALISFQKRSPQNEDYFMQILQREFTCFSVIHVDASEALSRVQWPRQVQEGAGHLDLSENFPFLLLKLRPGAEVPEVLPPEAHEERKPWW
ncbi:unnamed protein product, partial [Polarella glacialis]